MALFLSLVFLLVLTLIGVSSMRSTTLEERMAGNFRDRSLALEAAEAALREAESRIDAWELAPIDGSGCANDDCPEVWQRGVLDPSDDDVWSGSESVAFTEFTSSEGSVHAAPPRYYIEQISQSGSLSPDTTGDTRIFFRVTALGIGGSPDTRVRLQSTFSRLF